MIQADRYVEVDKSFYCKIVSLIVGSFIHMRLQQALLICPYLSPSTTIFQCALIEAEHLKPCNQHRTQPAKKGG
jgi:hypothetical protein